MIQSQIKSYISNVEIMGLNKLYQAKWQVSRGVNIISGVNGSGKSTLLQALSNTLTIGYVDNPSKPIKGIRVEFENGDTVYVDENNRLDKSELMCNVDVISTFDTSLIIKEAVQKLTDDKVKTDLDWNLYKAMERYLKYQLSIGKQAIELLKHGKSIENFKVIASQKDVYFDVLDEAFKDSHKTVVRDKDELVFNMNGIELSPYQLSSGEKQLIIILTLVLTQNRQPYVLIMDEPEISLHFEWQKVLLDKILLLNPNVQILTSTHSPAMVMEGWVSCVSDVSDIIRMIP